MLVHLVHFSRRDLLGTAGLGSQAELGLPIWPYLRISICCPVLFIRAAETWVIGEAVTAYML